MLKNVRAKLLIVSAVSGCLLFSGLKVSGQGDNVISIWELAGRDGQGNVVISSVPFLTISGDSRSAGMGDVGVATRPDIHSQHWNVAKYAFIEEDGGLSVTYTPWLRNLNITDIDLGYLSAYYRPSRDQVISGSLRYFSMGEITFRDETGSLIQNVNPFELAVDAGYSRLFTDHLSGGIAFRYIHSNLTMGTEIGGAESRPGIAVGADLGFYYTNEFRLSGSDVNWAAGVHLSNLGTPISYTVDSEKTPLPSNFRVGTSFEYELDDYNSISLALDLNKLLVPTPTYTYEDPDTGEEITRGIEPSSIVMGMIQSFYDAPGIRYDDGNISSTFVEELSEIMIGLGAEYWYRNQFAIRTGYFHESAIKGNRKYLTFGVGLNLNIFSLDFSYLVPTNGMQSPLANTIRFTLGFDFEDLNL